MGDNFLAKGPRPPGSPDQSHIIGMQLLAVAEKVPEFPAIISEDRILSYHELSNAVKSLAIKMASLGVGRNSIVAINTSDMFCSITGLFATSLLGAKYVVANKTLATVRPVKPTHFFRSSDVSGNPNVPFIRIENSWFDNKEVSDLDPETLFEGYANEDDDWLYLYTSGTTGTPKYICLSQKIVSSRTKAIQSDFPFASITFATFFACTSRPFFARAIGALLNACTLVEGQNLSFWVNTGVSFVSAAPGQTLGGVIDGQLTSKIKRIEVSGAKLDPETASLLLENFETVIDVYGASETNKSFAHDVTKDGSGKIVKTPIKFDSLVEIVDSNNRVCSEGEIGTVRVQNGYMVKEYLNDAKATAKSFRDGWFYPGDRATWGGNGELVIVGRDNEVVNMGGVKIDLALVDSVLKSVDGVVDAASFVNPKPKSAGELIAFVVLDDSKNRAPLLEKIKTYSDKRMGVALSPRNIRAIDQIPRSPDGSILREVCQEILLLGYSGKLKRKS